MIELKGECWAIVVQPRISSSVGPTGQLRKKGPSPSLHFEVLTFYILDDKIYCLRRNMIVGKLQGWSVGDGKTAT